VITSVPMGKRYCTWRGKKGRITRNTAATRLTELGLGDRLAFLPAKLRGREKQRAAIARALANVPVLVLADEPTANLDSRSGQTLVRLMVNMAKQQGKSVVIVSHDNRIQGNGHRILWLEDGKLLPKAG